MRTFGAFVLGVVVTVVVLAGGGWLYLHYGHPPVAAADPAFPMEAQIVHVPLGARIQREIQQPPFAGNAQVYGAGAEVYAERCEFCHGGPGQESTVGKWMYPAAPQLWKKHKTGSVVGVSDDEPGETFWKVKNGIRLTGMPAFQHDLSEEQMWDVTLLLKAADQPMPDEVKSELGAK
jgi:mono/diheme cytochrome c family protein